ncbi:hypothetical protein DUZ99_06250 [Xylanibacillus composti]|uniref:Uncharacterized protein n=1 Tax=Xylanibacillus composti TaxID=1572762 RepID=A0A8J4H3D9_9BACL|nr:hypothetical protein [Xylanibacillus composti]MDT9724593.1 hypothetical protein [Xylanibacillus composti]GIQ70247.1 hypothetical protein XYCOK13_30710 [Xylanibacillus composti]
MSVKIAIVEKKLSGEMKTIHEAIWNDTQISALDHANYLLVDGQEYEMLEGRLNVNSGLLEILVAAVIEDRETNKTEAD